jgi:hypothetical protein
MAPAITIYESRDPSRTVLYKVITAHLETFLTGAFASPFASVPPLLSSAALPEAFAPKNP